MRKRKMRFIAFAAGAVLAFLAVVSALLSRTDLISVSNAVNGRNLPIYCVDTDEKKVAISFDAAWGNDDTRNILAVLAEHNVHATFFMTGGWVESYPDDVAAIYEAGHDLGNHSENHKNMSQLSDEEIQEEILSVHEKVKELTGYEMFLFRPPYGDYDNHVISNVNDCGYYAIQWSIDSLDWKDYGADDIIDRVCNSDHLTGGAIILCHNGAKYTAQALDLLLTNLEAQGYEIVPVSELIYTENYHMDANGMQISDDKRTEAEGEPLSEE
ncbi:MAG: polysaccharide deacetylase family protein [Lachnospiraceae bacterium]|nr:polysaccharide deacetylase family protein [Lachnospiraceae bacterium]